MHDRDALPPALALAALIGGPDSRAGSRAGAADGRWGEVAALAASHVVAPLLYRRLTLAPPAPPPDAQALAALRRAYLRTMAANERARAQLTDLVAALASRGVAPVLLKGAHLAFGVYDDPATRPMGDLDLLVSPEQVPAAAAALEGRGYVPLSAYSLAAELANVAHLPAFVAQGRLPVELHWRLLRPAHPYRLDTAALIARSRPFAAVGGGARVLDPADVFLHLALHAIVKDALAHGLRALADLALLIAATPDDPSWGEAAERAREAGAERVHDLALALLERFLPGWLPRPLPISAAGPAPEEPAFALACQLALEATGRAVCITPNLAGAFAAGPAAAVRRILGRALPSRDELEVLDPDAAGRTPLLLRYPRRWVTLIARHGPALWSLLRGDEVARRGADRIARGTALAAWCAGAGR